MTLVEKNASQLGQFSLKTVPLTGKDTEPTSMPFNAEALKLSRIYVVLTLFIDK